MLINNHGIQEPSLVVLKYICFIIGDNVCLLIIRHISIRNGLDEIGFVV